MGYDLLWWSIISTLIIGLKPYWKIWVNSLIIPNWKFKIKHLKTTNQYAYHIMCFILGTAFRTVLLTTLYQSGARPGREHVETPWNNGELSAPSGRALFYRFHPGSPLNHLKLSGSPRCLQRFARKLGAVTLDEPLFCWVCNQVLLQPNESNPLDKRDVQSRNLLEFNHGHGKSAIRRCL